MKSTQGLFSPQGLKASTFNVQRAPEVLSVLSTSQDSMQGNQAIFVLQKPTAVPIPPTVFLLQPSPEEINGVSIVTPESVR
jgi:hypothetical protein